MLYVISSVSDSLVSLFNDDPVRPEISVDFRCSWPNNFVFVLKGDSGSPLAVLCCSLKDYVPCSMDQLLYSGKKLGSTAIFYSVWSYSKGSGRRIIPLVREWFKVNSNVENFYTYSPKGEGVRNFHLGLGAELFRENVDSINYVYR